MAFDPPCGLKAVASPLTPLLSAPRHGARPGGTPIAPGAMSVLLFVIQQLGAQATVPDFRGAAQPPHAAPPQDLLDVPNDNQIELTSRGVPPGGKEQGTREEKETLTWLMGGDGGAVASHAVPDDPQTEEITEDNPKSGECRADSNEANRSRER